MKALMQYQMSAAEKQAMKVEVARQARELSDRFSTEINATILWALHEEFGFGAERLRRYFDCVEKYRMELIEKYEMQDDAEFILLYKLREIGVDLKKWCDETKSRVVLKG